VARALAGALGVEVDRVELVPLHGGACQEMFKVDASIRGETKRFVLRSDAKSSIPGSLDRRIEYAVIEKARSAGVRTPNSFGLTEGLVRPEAHAYFMEWVDGETIGAKVLRDPSLANARAALPDALAKELALIHTIDVKNAAELEIPKRDEIAAQRESIDRLPEPRPALERALSWLDAKRPTSNEVTLVHGDFRTGNFAVRPDGLAAIFDWEFAHWGSPFEDLAWLCMRDWRFGQVKNAAGGICPRADFYAAYERASGRRVDPEVVRWWEVMSNVKWAVGAVVQSQRYLGGAESDLELLSIGRRVQEMEHEALRLIGA
jgi:aminoglycoside phosphotransferase (APT) family kinase protein